MSEEKGKARPRGVRESVVELYGGPLDGKRVLLRELPRAGRELGGEYLLSGRKTLISGVPTAHWRRAGERPF